MKQKDPQSNTFVSSYRPNEQHNNLSLISSKNIQLMKNQNFIRKFENNYSDLNKTIIYYWDHWKEHHQNGVLTIQD